MFGAIRNDDIAPDTRRRRQATPDAGMFPLTITGEAVGGDPTSVIAGYRWWLLAPSGTTDVLETVAPTIELDLAEVGTFELRAAALDDAGNASHSFNEAPRTTIAVEDRVPVIEIDDLIVDEDDGVVTLDLLDQVDVILPPGGDWMIWFVGSVQGPGLYARPVPGTTSSNLSPRLRSWIRRGASATHPQTLADRPSRLPADLRRR